MRRLIPIALLGFVAILVGCGSDQAASAPDPAEQKANQNPSVGAPVGAGGAVDGGMEGAKGAPPAVGESRR